MVDARTMRARMELLKQFDYYVRNIIGDDEITCNTWLPLGVPDEYTEEDLKDIALDNACWRGVVFLFANCCRIGD